MLLSEELLNKLSELKNEIKNLREENKVEEAHGRLKELENLKKEIEVAKAIENEEMEDIQNKIETRKEVDYMLNSRALLNKVAVEDKEKFQNIIRNVSTGLTAGDNGFVIPNSISEVIYARVGEISPIFNRVKKFYTGGDMTFVKEGNGVTVNYVAEEGAIPASKPTLGKVTLNSFIIACLVKVSKSLVNRSGIDIVGYVIEEISKGMKKFIEHEVVVGTSAKARGLISVTNAIESATTTGITGDDLIDLQMAVDDSIDGVFVMNTNTLKSLRKLKGTDGQYLLTSSLVEGFKYQLLNSGVIVSKEMPDDKIVYGDLQGMYVKFTDDIKMQVLTEKYADTYQNGYIATAEFDCAPVEDVLAILSKKTV